MWMFFKSNWTIINLEKNKMKEDKEEKPHENSVVFHQDDDVYGFSMSGLLIAPIGARLPAAVTQSLLSPRLS